MKFVNNLELIFENHEKIMYSTAYQFNQGHIKSFKKELKLHFNIQDVFSQKQKDIIRQ